MLENMNRTHLITAYFWVVFFILGLTIITGIKYALLDSIDPGSIGPKANIIHSFPEVPFFNVGFNLFGQFVSIWGGILMVLFIAPFYFAGCFKDKKDESK